MERNGKQVQTERGLIYMCDMFTTPERAEKFGYSFAFHSRELDCDCYSVITGNNRREFALVYNRELNIRESYEYRDYGKRDVIKAPKGGLELMSCEVYGNKGKFIMSTSTKRNTTVYAIRDGGEIEKVEYLKGYNYSGAGRFFIVSKETAMECIEEAEAERRKDGKRDIRTEID